MRLLTPAETARLSGQPLTYPEVGATAGELPAGYRVLRRERPVPRPASVDFTAAREALFAWRLHENAGLEVAASGPVAPEAVVRLGLRLGPLRVAAACRVVRVVDEPGHVGFAYGTLPGHPERGEESFEVIERDDGLVVRIVAFSRPARLHSRLGAPITRLVQDRMLERYLAAFD